MLVCHVEKVRALLDSRGPGIGEAIMGAFEHVLMRTFGRPRGVLGRLGGIVMARTNPSCASWVIALLQICGSDRILEVGFGPGVGIQLLAATPSVHVDGIDASQEMVQQATARNSVAIRRGRVDLGFGSVERLPFDDNTFDKVLSINSMQVWPDSRTALSEIRRVMKVGGTAALGFNSYSGQQSSGLSDELTAAGFVRARLVETDRAFCVLAVKP